jgi:hypothetical protein
MEGMAKGVCLSLHLGMVAQEVIIGIPFDLTSSNYDGYTNSILTITIGAIDKYNNHPSYSEQCSAQLAVTYSSGSGGHILTTDWPAQVYSLFLLSVSAPTVTEEQAQQLPSPLEYMPW